MRPRVDAGGTGRGTVALVGGGPGDPELITVRGRRLLAAADVVVVDRLAPGLLLDELRPDAELVDASKIPYGPARAQEEINTILVDRARQAGSSCGSRAATRTCSAVAARRPSRAPLPASRDASYPASPARWPRPPRPASR